MRSKAPTRLQVSGELDLIDVIRRRASAARSPGLRLGIGDDCALLRLRPGEELAITTDLSIDTRHFYLGIHPPEAIGHRTLARGLSDLAAMGARPVAAFLSLGLPSGLVRQGSMGHHNKKSWADRFFDGLFALAAAHNTPLAGGDLSQSPLAVADIVLLGAVPRDKALLRSSARPGDRIYVTGSLGGASAGLALLAQLARKAGGKLHSIPQKLAPVLAPHLYPQPRVAQGLRLRGLASAAMDISDGLSLDLYRLCQASGVSAQVEVAQLPIALGATLHQALHGGEDYELLFTARESARIPRSIAGVSLTCIGHILPARKGRPTVALFVNGKVEPLTPSGWQHFS